MNDPSPKIILASASPRRIEMLTNAGFDIKVMPADIDEHVPMVLSPPETVMFLALAKALAVRKKIYGTNTGVIAKYPDESIIVAADTVVVLDGEILGKPKYADDAARMISRMSGRSHYVYTGVCLCGHSVPVQCFYEKSEVFFINIPEDELAAYVETDEPYDKAGAYAIQGTFSKYTDHIVGDLDNIIGFPLARFKSLLKR